MAATLQRSTISFRREGSSGAVWDDQKLIAQMDEQGKRDGLRHSYSVGGPLMVESSSNAAADANPVYIRSRSASAVKMLIPKSVGRKFKGVLGIPAKSKLSGTRDGI